MYQVTNYIMYAIPVFLILIGIEVFVAWRTKRHLYRFNDSVSDLSAGVFDQVIGAFMSILLLGLYILIYEKARLEVWAGPAFAIKPTATWAVVLTFVILFFAYDHQYYWFHRLSHEINFIWGSHVAHHSSEEYNLSVALRQGGFQRFFSFSFYIPLALIGFHPIMFAIVGQFVTLYQFWIHTRAVDKLPAWFEWFFNTPSNHRVHHGRNPQYIDRNHAGTFMIWDRMYGTFEPEGEEVVYGIVSPLNTWNPLWAQVHYFVEVFKLAWAAPRWRDKFLVWVKEPGWMPEGMGPHKKAPPVDARQYAKFGFKLPTGLNLYVALHFVTCIPALVFLMLFVRSETLPALAKGGIATYIVGTMLFMGLLLDLRPYAFAWEFMRLVLLATVGIKLGMEAGNMALVYGSAAGAVVLAGWLLSYRKEFQQPVESRVLQSALHPGV